MYLPVAVVNRLYAEETRLHLSQVFSTKISRAQLFWTTTVTAALAGVLGVLVASVSLGGAALASMGDDSPMGLADFMAAGANQLPIVLFFAGLAALVLGWLPQLGKAVYVYLGYVIMIS